MSVYMTCYVRLCTRNRPIFTSRKSFDSPPICRTKHAVCNPDPSFIKSKPMEYQRESLKTISYLNYRKTEASFVQSLETSLPAVDRKIKKKIERAWTGLDGLGRTVITIRSDHPSVIHWKFKLKIHVIKLGHEFYNSFVIASQNAFLF